MSISTKGCDAFSPVSIADTLAPLQYRSPEASWRQESFNGHTEK